MANVKARVFLKARVNIQNDTSGPKEGRQWHDMKKCWVTCSLSEWNWRFQAASDILCGGITDYTYYGEAVGAGWI